jgi:actinorhodin biosynthesis protein ActVIA
VEGVMAVKTNGAQPQLRTEGLYEEVRVFYARQVRLLDDLEVDDYVATFAEDGVVDHAHRGERVQGRPAMAQAMRAALPRYANVVLRHWFDHLLIEPVDQDTLTVSYYALVTRTDADGNVAFEPTFTINDVLVRRDGALYTQSRTINRDRPAGVS